MKPHPANGNDSRERSPDSERDEVMILVKTMADTTWRVFTPVLLCAGAGVWLDVTWGTKPWVTLLGILLGFGGAVLLVRAQIKKVQKS